MRTLAIPLMLAQFAQAIYTVLDAIFVGQVFPLQSAATMYSLSIAQYFPLGFGIAIAMGGNSVIAGHIGKRSFRDAERSAATMIQLGFIATACYMIIILPSLDKLLPILGTTDETFDYARRYCNIVIGGMILLVVANILMNILIAQGFSGYSSIASVCGILTNLIIDPSIVIGGRDGILGSAVSILAGNTMVILICLPRFLPGKYRIPIHIKVKDLFKWNSAIVKEIISYAFGVFFMFFAYGLVITMINHNITKFASSPLEAEAVAATIGTVDMLLYIFFSLSSGITISFMTAGSFAYQAKMTRRARKLAWLSIKWSTYVLIFGSVVFTAFAKWWPYVFYGKNDAIDEAFRAACTKQLYIMAPSRSIVSITFLAFAIFQGAGMMGMAAVQGALRQIILLIPCIYIFAYTLKKPIYISISYPVSDIGATIIAWVTLYIYRDRVFLTKRSVSGPLMLGGEDVDTVTVENDNNEVVVDTDEIRSDVSVGDDTVLEQEVLSAKTEN